MAQRSRGFVLVGLAVGFACVMTVTGTVVASPTQFARRSTAVPGLGGITGMSKGEISQWSHLVAAAQQDKNLVIVTGDNTLQPLFSAFTAEFGIPVTNLQFSPTLISSRILAERQQGVHAEDLVMAGNGATMRLLNGGAFQPLQPNLILKADTDPSDYYYPRFPWCAAIDPTEQYCAYYSVQPSRNVINEVYYNTNAITTKDLAKIKTWNDLINKKYSGKMVLQNVVQGADATDMALSYEILGPKYWENFFNVDKPLVLPSGSDVAAVDGLARGTYDFAFFAGDVSPYELAVTQGLPVAYLAKTLKPGPVPDFGSSVAMVAQAPDQAAAQLFVNWLFAPEGQAAFNKFASIGRDEIGIRDNVPRYNAPVNLYKGAQGVKGKAVLFQRVLSTTFPVQALAWWTQEFEKLNIH